MSALADDATVGETEIDRGFGSDGLVARQKPIGGIGDIRPILHRPLGDEVFGTANVSLRW